VSTAVVVRHGRYDNRYELLAGENVRVSGVEPSVIRRTASVPVGAVEAQGARTTGGETRRGLARGDEPIGLASRVRDTATPAME
jgi:hypothetical protein